MGGAGVSGSPIGVVYHESSPVICDVEIPELIMGNSPGLGDTRQGDGSGGRRKINWIFPNDVVSRVREIKISAVIRNPEGIEIRIGGLDHFEDRNKSRSLLLEHPYFMPLRIRHDHGGPRVVGP